VTAIGYRGFVTTALQRLDIAITLKYKKICDLKSKACGRGGPRYFLEILGAANFETVLPVERYAQVDEKSLSCSGVGSSPYLGKDRQL